MASSSRKDDILPKQHLWAKDIDLKLSAPKTDVKDDAKQVFPINISWTSLHISPIDDADITIQKIYYMIGLCIQIDFKP